MNFPLLPLLAAFYTLIAWLPFNELTFPFEGHAFFAQWTLLLFLWRLCRAFPAPVCHFRFFSIRFVNSRDADFIGRHPVCLLLNQLSADYSPNRWD